MATHEAYLRTALGKYQYADIAKRDILHAFQTYTDLRPKLDTFVFNDGSRKELLCLEGTIPVSYKGSTYNIPICLWLMDTHPYNPPMVYVKPTQTMQIKQGKHVDANGKIYLPYLHEWKHPTSDLLGLIQVLAIVFGEEPPVFSRSASRPQPPPYPAAGATPYPATGSGMPVPGGYPASTGYPPSTAGGYPSYPAYPQASGYPGGTNSQAGGYPAYPSYNPAATTATTQSNAAVANHTPTATAQNSLSLSDEQIRASILSAVEDKMRRRLKDIFAQASAEMTALNRTQEDLQKGKNTLDEMMQKLEREQNEVERNITILTEKNEEIKNVLTRMENREEVDIDEAVVPTAPLYRQLLTTFAEEQATEDAIYYLHEGLKRGVIDLEVYLKQVRELSRKQYMCRALIARCRQKAGLPEL